MIKKNIVVIGGGTGLSSLLLGLKKYNYDISAIVAVADDGGSSGRLRQNYDILPTGDIRNCLVSLAEQDTLMSKLFSYRFRGNSEIAGHNFGNLFIMAMTEVFGSFENALLEVSKILAVNGNVFPSTFEKVNLVAKKNNNFIYGETDITSSDGNIDELLIEPRDCKASSSAISAILKSDVIIFGPGSFYTSIISNLLIQDIKNAILNSKSLKIFVCNIMSQKGETDGYKTSTYLQILEKYLKKNIINHVLINNQKIPKKIMEKYAKSHSYQVEDDLSSDIKVLANLFGKKISENSLYARHSPLKLARNIKSIIEENY